MHTTATPSTAARPEPPTAATPADEPPAGLHVSTPQRLPFGRLDARAFLLARPTGNVLIYANAELGADASRFERLGGIERRYLGHWHEAMFEPDPDAVGDAPLFVHAGDAGETVVRRPVRATFSRRHRHGADLEVIPIPGHTPGSTAYLWDNGSERVLFTADSVYTRGAGRWVGAMLDSSDREAYVASLELLASLRFDVLVPWATGAGAPAFERVEPAEGRRRLLEIAARLRAGADH